MASDECVWESVKRLLTTIVMVLHTSSPSMCAARYVCVCAACFGISLSIGDPICEHVWAEGHSTFFRSCMCMFVVIIYKYDSSSLVSLFAACILVSFNCIQSVTFDTSDLLICSPWILIFVVFNLSHIIRCYLFRMQWSCLHSLSNTLCCAYMSWMGAWIWTGILQKAAGFMYVDALLHIYFDWNKQCQHNLFILLFLFLFRKKNFILTLFDDW